MIELDNIRVSFGDKRVLDGFSGRFAQPGVYALMGPSGCGKTTLLRVIAGLQAPDSGRITRPDTPISFCFQEDRLLPWYTIAQNVALAIRADTPDASLRIAHTWLHRVGLGDECSARPDELSGGMKRRAALARALAYDAPVLLMDEPFRALDEKTHMQMLRLVRSCAQGKLLILATHDERDAEGMTCVRMDC